MSIGRPEPVRKSRRQACRRSGSGEDRRRQRRALFVEQLEDRRLLAVRVWDGGGGTDLWSNPENWVGDVAPQQDDNLVFPNSGGQHINVNDYADGMRFRSVTLSAADYDISADTGAHGITLLEGLVYNATASGATFDVPIMLGAAQTFYAANAGAQITLGDVAVANLQALAVDGRGNIEIGGVLSGTGALNKAGDGTLILAGDNNTAGRPYEGIITITQGAVNVRHSNGLGATTAGTIVSTGGVLQVQGTGLDIPEPIVISQYGVGFDAGTLGALRNVSGSNTFSGNITLGTHASIGVDAGTLTVTGRIMNLPGVSDGQLFKFGPGDLELGGGGDNVTNAAVNVLQGKLILNKPLQAAVVTTTPGSASNNEIQQVTVTVGAPSYSLTFNGQTTAAIAADASAAAVQTALEGLSTIGSGNVSVTGSNGGPWTVTFQGALGLADVAALVASRAVPFSNNLLIGDNRDGVSNPAVVELAQPDQLPELNFYKTGITTVTVNSNGTLDLHGNSDTIASLALVTGRSRGGVVQTGTGTLTLLNNIDVTAFPGSSGAVDVGNADTGLASAALIKGRLDVGSFFSGAGGVGVHTITAADTALANPAADLVIAADIAGGSLGMISKAGAGTLRLTGANTYSGPTRLTAGITEIGSPNAFGNSSLVAISGGSLVAQGSARSVDRPISLDGNFSILGPNALTFSSTTQSLLTGSRTITTLDPSQVTTFRSGLAEGLSAGSGPGLTKIGRGELNIAGPSTFTGALTIGGANADGGVLRFSQNGTLRNNVNAITVRNGELILDNATADNNDRITDQAAITLIQGRIALLANSAGTTETLGVVTVTNTGTLESDATAGSSRLSLGGLTAGAGTSVNFAGAGAALSESGANQINILQPPGTVAMVNNVIPNAVALGPGGAADLATYAGGPNGFAAIPLPPEGYVTSFDAANPTSNVKITTSSPGVVGGVLNIDSRTVNALVLGPGVTLAGNSPATTTLTIANGPLVFDGSATLGVPYTQFGIAQPVIFTDASGTGTVSKVLTGGTATNLIKAGTGTLALEGANQFTATLNSNQGVLRISNSSALGSPAGSTTVNYGSQLQVSNDITVLGEAVTVAGMGLPTATGAGVDDGAILNLSGNNQLTGAVTLTRIDTIDGATLFPNASAATFLGAGINVKAGSLNLSGAVAGSAATTELVKLGTGQLEISGIGANTTNTGAVRVQRGTLFLNNAAGLATWNSSTWTIGDDLAGTATLKLGDNDQIPATANVQIASNGLMELGGHNDTLASFVLEIGPLGGSVVNLGAGNLAVNGSVTVQSLGGGNSTGASINGGRWD